MAAVVPAPYEQRPASAGPMQQDMLNAPPRPPSAASLSMQQSSSSPLLPYDQSLTSAAGYNPPAGLFKSHHQAQPYVLPSPAYGMPYQSHQAPYYPGMFDGKMGGRTVSHAHPMHSADATASSRYSTSPPSAGDNFQPPSAGAHGHGHGHGFTYNWHGPAPAHGQTGTPLLSVNEPLPDLRHDHSMNPNMLSYPMSRSTSGASDGDVQRLLTPHMEYNDRLSPGAQDLRKVSDGLRPFSAVKQEYSPYPYAAQGHNMYSQPGHNNFWTRGDAHQPAQQVGFYDRKGSMNSIPENDYERERQQQISGNRQLLETLGLGHGSGYHSDRHGSVNIRSRKATPKKRAFHDPIRSSPRIASIHRSVSYADLDGEGDAGSEGSDYSDEASYEEDDYRPAKRGRGMMKGRKGKQGGSRKSNVELSLWGLFQTYPSVLQMFPLFYYTLNNDLSINSESVPMIGSIPCTVTPIEKAETLRQYFHRGRRVLAQLDSFTMRCDRKYEGPQPTFPELDSATRVAIRDIRRKVVERCENYKYTRRDLLNKNLGKNAWQPIEHGLIEWKFGMPGDPANDIQNVTLTEPAPPAHILAQQQAGFLPQQIPMAPLPYGQQSAGVPGRSIRPMPSRARLASAADPGRIMSVNMEGDGSATSTPALATGHTNPHTAMVTPNMNMGYPYANAHQVPMFNDDQAPMSVQMPVALSQSNGTSPMNGNGVSAVANEGVHDGGAAQMNSWMPVQQPEPQGQADLASASSAGMGSGMVVKDEGDRSGNESE